MSEYSFTVAAAVGSYYKEAARGPSHLPGIFAFERYIDGIMRYPSMLHEIAAGEQDPAFRPPTLEQWVASPEADAAITARVNWQERYEDQLAAPVKEAFYHVPKASRYKGNFMEAVVFIHGDEQLVAKRPLPIERDIGARRIESAVSALVLEDEVHPTLEQIRAFSYSRGIVTVYKPGKPPAALSPDELAAVKPDNMEFAVEGLVLGALSGVKLDSAGRNMVVDPAGNINFFDLTRPPHVSTESLLKANFNGFLWLLGDASMGAPHAERQKIRDHLQEQALKVIHAADPDFVHTQTY